MATGTRWIDLSQALTTLVEAVAGSVVRVDRRGAVPSSGVVWDRDGTVVTASHGVEDDEAEVGLPSGETASARVLGRDPALDLAVLRVDAPGLAPPPWTADRAAVGQLVLCVSRPGRGPRAALGIVARAGDAWRTPAGGKVDRYLELDVGVHAGFSGGLVADAAGGALGLAAAALLRRTPLVIPTATLDRVVPALVAHGGVRRGYLGLASLPARVPLAVGGPDAGRTGLLVTAVDDGSPAARAGLMVGDLLLALGGTVVASVGDLLAALEEAAVGAVARARVARGGALHEVDVTVGVREEGRP